MQNKFLILLLIFLNFQNIYSYTPNPKTLLKKLSFALKGKPPTQQELKTFQENFNKEENWLNAYNKKLDQYFAEEEYYQRLVQFYSSEWVLPQQETAHTFAYLIFNEYEFDYFFDHPFILLDDVNWNRYFGSGALILDPVPRSSKEWLPIRLKSSETRFTNFFEHYDFLSRYPDTPTNKNRARSNYVYEKFLCDTLSPADETTTNTEYWDHEHGTNPDCIGCHQRLDPAARFFDRWTNPNADLPPQYNSNKESGGNLWIKNLDGGYEEIKTKSTQGLASFLKDHPRVHECFAKKTWRWFVSESNPIPHQTMYNAGKILGETRSFNEMFRYILQHEYFWTEETVPPSGFESVTKSFDVCTKCHKSDGNISPKFNPKQYPFNPDPIENKNLLKNIWRSISGQGNKIMPPLPFRMMTQEQLNGIKVWINNGAYTENSQITLNENEIEEVLNGE